MKKAAISAACAGLLLLSRLGATQLAAVYTAIVVLPFTTRNSGAMPAAVSLGATVSATWHSFDLIASAVSVVVATASLIRYEPPGPNLAQQTAAAPKVK